MVVDSFCLSHHLGTTWTAHPPPGPCPHPGKPCSPHLSPAPPALGGPRRHLQLVGFDPCAFVSASFELGRELLGVRPSHGLAFLQWGVVGEGSLQQHPGTLEGCCQERRGEPGPLPGEAARGRTGPLHSKPAVTASLKARGAPPAGAGRLSEAQTQFSKTLGALTCPVASLRPMGGPAWEAQAGVLGAPGEPDAPDGGGACALREACEQFSRASECRQDTFRGPAGRDHFLRLMTFI